MSALLSLVFDLMAAWKGRGDASVNIYFREFWNWRVINTKHLDTNQTSAAWREVGRTGKAAKETCRVEKKGEESKGEKREDENETVLLNCRE